MYSTATLFLVSCTDIAFKIISPKTDATFETVVNNDQLSMILALFFADFIVREPPFPDLILSLLASHGKFHFKFHCGTYFGNSLFLKTLLPGVPYQAGL